MKRLKRHPLNADGDFFVEYDICLACDAPFAEAPELMTYDENMHCYFKRQPETPEELEHAINAVRVSCVEAVLYEGNDPDILRKISEMPCANKADESKKNQESIFERVLKIFGK